MRIQKSEDLITCFRCGEETPEENLNCIYCGELLKQPVGMISSLVFGRKGWLGFGLALLVLLALLIWLL